MIKITVQRPGTSLDLLLWRQHGIGGAQLLERALNSNPGLAELGSELPLGTVVWLPELTPSARTATRAVIDLFGEA